MKIQADKFQRRLKRERMTAVIRHQMLSGDLETKHLAQEKVRKTIMRLKRKHAIQQLKARMHRPKGAFPCPGPPLDSWQGQPL